MFPPPSLRCVRVIPVQSLVFCIVLCRLLFVLFSLGHSIVSPIFAWSLYCRSYFRLVIVLSVLFSLGHCIVCPIFAWTLYYLSYFDIADDYPLLSSNLSLYKLHCNDE